MSIIITRVEDKINNIQKVALPNFIQNRFDIKYGNDYELYKIIEDNKNEIYIPVKIKGNEIEIGVWLLDIKQKSFDIFIDYILNNYKECNIINAKNLLIPYPGLKKLYHYSISENNFDEYLSKLSKTTRKNLRNKINLINRQFKVKINQYCGVENIPLELVEQYFKWKQSRIKNVWIQSPLEYLKTYFVTDAYEMKYDDKTVACAFIVNFNNTVYMENSAYDISYSKYSQGIVMRFLLIKHLLSINKNYLDIGTGYFDSYKKHLYKDIRIVYNGSIIRKHNLIFNNIFEFKENISPISTIKFHNFIFIYTKNIIYYGNIINNNLSYDKIESLYDLNKDIDILYIEDSYNAFDILYNIKSIEIKTICLKAEHDRNMHKYVFEDLENILINEGYSLLGNKREKLSSYTYWIKNKYEKNIAINTNTLPKICLDAQKYIESSKLKRILIKKTLRFHKKEYIHSMRPIFDNYDKQYKQLKDKNSFIFLLNTYDVRLLYDKENNQLGASISIFNDAIKYIDIK